MQKRIEGLHITHTPILLPHLAMPSSVNCGTIVTELREKETERERERERERECVYVCVYLTICKQNYGIPLRIQAIKIKHIPIGIPH